MDSHPAAGQLVARERELTQLEPPLDRLDRGEAACMTVEGEPGIGMTRLLRELQARADARGDVVLFGSASEFERDLPFSVFVDALDACGSVRMRDEARRELRKLGGRREARGRTTVDDSGVDALTSRERETSELITDRLTNKEIASRLFLSQKTVESHIRNIFHKLGASSRVEVARIVERERRERDASAEPA